MVLLAGIYFSGAKHLDKDLAEQGQRREATTRRRVYKKVKQCWDAKWSRRTGEKTAEGS